jgi:hypothetical protein
MSAKTGASPLGASNDSKHITKTIAHPGEKTSGQLTGKRAVAATVGARKKQRRESTPAEDAVLKVERVGENIVLQLAPDWLKVLPSKADEDDPGVLVDWDHGALDAFVGAANAPGAALPAFMSAGAAASGGYTAAGVQTAILNRVAVVSGGGVVGRMLVAPNTVSQYSNVCCALRMAEMDPQVQAVLAAGGGRPLAAIFKMSDNLKPNTAVPDPLLPAYHTPLFV